MDNPSISICFFGLSIGKGYHGKNGRPFLTLILSPIPPKLSSKQCFVHRILYEKNIEHEKFSVFVFTIVI